MMNKYNNLIIDVNEFYKSAFSVICKNNANEAQDFIINKTIQLCFQMILKVKSNYLIDDGFVYVLADNPTSKLSIRKKLDEDYKSTRIKESDGYYRGIDFELLICQYYSEQFNTCRVKRLEADDLVPEILKLCNGDTLLCSSDLDWARCMSDKVHWYNHKEIFTQQSFKSRFKYTPDERSITLMKVLMGDLSDNIPPIKGMNEQTALNIVLNFDDTYEVLSCLKKNTEKSYLVSDYVRKLLLANEDRLLKNHNLVYFCEVSKEEVSQALIKGSFNSNALSILYKSLNFPTNFDSRIEDKKISFGDIFSSFDEVQRR